MVKVCCQAGFLPDSCGPSRRQELPKLVYALAAGAFAGPVPCAGKLGVLREGESDRPLDLKGPNSVLRPCPVGY